ncbi:unnamed protein product, partial [Meganyctiphanes norvegica]
MACRSHVLDSLKLQGIIAGLITDLDLNPKVLRLTLCLREAVFSREQRSDLVPQPCQLQQGRPLQEREPQRKVETIAHLEAWKELGDGVAFSIMGDYEKEGKIRPIIDLSALNKCLVEPGYSFFKYCHLACPQPHGLFPGVLLDLKNLTLSLPVEKVNRIEAIGNSGKGLVATFRRDLERMLFFIGRTGDTLLSRRISDRVTVHFFHRQLAGLCVRVISNNTTALACIRRQGSLASPAFGPRLKKGDHFHGMVFGSRVLLVGLQESGHSTGGPVCHSGQYPTAWLFWCHRNRCRTLQPGTFTTGTVPLGNIKVQVCHVFSFLTVQASLSDLTKKTLALIMLSTGRRASEVAAISRVHKRRDGRIYLLWQEDFCAKAESAGFTPEDPSIGVLDRNNRSTALCPVRAWDAYRSRRPFMFPSRVGHCFWPLSQGTLQYLLKELILDSRVFMGKSKGIPAGSHQFRKFAASYSQKFLALSSDHCEVLRKRMGCKSLKILGKLIPGVALFDIAEWNRRHLLEYIINDEECHHQLEGLSLLPLANGSWCHFSRSSQKIYLCSTEQAQALVGIEYRILERSLSENVTKCFEMIAQKGTTQIETFDLELYGPLLIEESIAVQQKLNPDSASLHKWLSSVWSMLCNISLKSVQHLPLIPTKSAVTMSDLIPLNTTFIVQTDNYNLSDNVCQSLKSLNINVIGLEDYVRHSDIHYFMCDSTSSGLIKAICKAMNSSNINSLANNFNIEATESYSCSFIESLPVENIPTEVKNLLIHLKIFKATDMNGRNYLTSIKECSQVYPQNCDFPLTFHETTLHARNNRELRLIQLLGASLLSIETICLSSLRITHTKENLQNLVIYIMKNEHLINNCSIQMQLKSTKFVPNQHGILCQPSDLYDPLDEYAEILEGDLLPCYSFQKYLSFLKVLGLKQVLHISSNKLLEIVTSLSSMKDSLNKSFIILKLINNHSEINQICSKIRSVPCVPGTDYKAPNYPVNLHWVTNRRLYCPEEVKSFEVFGRTLGSSLPMANTVHIQRIADYFQWEEKPSATVFVQHLKNIISSFNSADGLFIDLIRRCYLELSSFVANASEADSLKELVDLPCILTKHGLKRASEVYLQENNNDLDLKPYFSSPLFKPHEEVLFFRYLGCLEDQSKHLYLTLLKNLHNDYTFSTLNESEIRERDLKLIINILERLEKIVDAEDKEKLFIPVETSSGGFELIPLAQCCYADHNLSWLNFDKDNNTEVRIIHSKVDINLAKALGVPPLQKQLLSCGIPIMKWGQSQSLTSRLRDLLEQYRDGVAVLKELVQNADDAGAHSVCFLYDERQNEDSRTGCMTAMLGEVQGPALWAYNDKVFSQNDLENIIKLGGRTKEGQSTKIGKFGLGFCSVYNLTDVPSFISGSNYVVFDPHMTFIERNDPGIRYDFSLDNNRKIINWFGGQFKPFEDVFDYKNGSYFNGTLFRLPLRTPSQATRSEISNVAYGPDQILQLLKMFMEMAGNLLLFTQNIKEIKIYHLNKYSSPKESKLMFHTKREINRMMQINNNSLKDVNTTSTQVQKVSELVTCFSSPFQEIIHLNVSVDISSVGKSLCNIEEGSMDTSWIISWHSGGPALAEQAKNLHTLPLGAVALPIDKQLDGWMPKSLETLPNGFYKTSHLHCFLPLPIETCFPVHINGYFEVASDRRSIKLPSSDDRSGVKDWNLELINNCIVSAYHNLLIALRLEGLSPEYKYYGLWPLQKICFDILQQELVKSFYEEISENDIQCFSDNGVWYSLSQCSFLEESFYSQKKVGELAFDFLDQYLEADNRKMIELPKDYAEELGNEVLDNLINPEDFYLDYFIPNINENYIHEDERDDLVLFALEAGSEAVLTEFSEIECISTIPFGKLQKPRSLVDPDSKVGALYSACEERFPINKYLKSSHVRDVLKGLGMMQVIVPMEILIERADTVQTILCAQCAIERCKSLLSYITYMYANKFYHENEVSGLKNIFFLPVESKPPDWECSWAGDVVAGTVSKTCQNHQDSTYKEIKFAKPSSLFISNLKNLVGSSKLVLDNIIQSPFALDILDVEYNSRTIPYMLVIQQLHCVSTELHDYTSKWLTDICKEIYAFLDANLQRYKNTQLSMESKIECDEFCKDIKDLKNENILLTKVGFYSAKVFTSNRNIDCSPDLFSIHNEILRLFPNLITALDIKEFFGPEVIIDVLRLKGQNLKLVNLTEDNITQYSKLLNILSQELNEAKKTEPNIIQHLDLLNICLPDKNGYLLPAGELCTDDGLNTKTKRFSFVHPNLSLSYELTEALGIKSVTRKVLQESSDRIPFGQSEKLTTRIRNILEDYPCDEGIMKEFIQNADDAGATEIKFIMDMRNLPTGSLFDESYAPLQGPALCIFNNSSFSAEDLQGITNLGNSTKKNDPESTGQYGIGFNAVYHMTDAPSFLTRGGYVPNGEALCMFDPLCKYDPESTPQNPGVQYKNLQKLRELHADSFKGYLEDDIMKGNGTLFRLPLRTDENSDISKKVLKVTDIEQMMKKFKTHMHESLFFLKNIRKISVQKILTNGKRKNEYTVISSLDNTGKVSLNNFKEYIKNQILLSKGEEPIPLCNIKQLRVDYQLDIKDSEANSFRWHIVQQIGSSDPDTVPKLVLGAFCNEELRLLPHAGAAVLLDKKSHTNISHVVSCYLPLPSKSGLPFSIHGHFALNSSRRDLWTGEDSIKGIWNTWLIQQVLTPAAASAIDHFRINNLPHDKSLLTLDDYKMLMKPYYNLLPLKSDAMSGNWTNFVKDLYQYIKEESLSFFDVFILEGENMIRKNHQQTLPTKKQELEKTKRRNKEQTLPTKKQNDSDIEIRGTLYWHPLNGDQFPVYFQEPQRIVYTALENQKTKICEQPTVENTLKKLGMNIGSNSMFVKLNEAEINPSLLTPDAALNFLSSWESHNSDSCKIYIGTKVEHSPLQCVKNVGVMIEYLCHSEHFIEKMNCLPLLVTQDHIIRQFSEESPVFLSEFYDILPKSSKEFINQTQISNNKTSQKFSNSVKSFKITDFAQRIHQELREEYFTEDNKNRSRKNIKDRWLNRVWKFIESDMPKKNKTNLLENSDIDWKEGNGYLLENLGKWALYPIIYNDEKYVIPIMHANKVLNCEKERECSPFKKLPVPTPDFSVENIKSTELAASLTDPSAVLNILHMYHKQICNILQIKTKSKKGVIEHNLKKDDALKILKYFGKHLKSENNLEENSLDRKQLQHLPFYVDLSDCCITIDDRKAIVLPFCFSTVTMGIKEMAEDLGYAILIHETLDLKPLYKYLDFSFTDHILDLYSSFILPNFDYLHEEFHKKHLEFLNGFLQHLNLKGIKEDSRESRVVNQLQMTSFIKYGNTFHEACEFYAPFNDIFKCMQMSYLPKEWCDIQWTNFLILAGIIHEVQPDHFLQIAKELAKMDKQKFIDIEEKSMILMKHLYTNITEFECHFNELKDIEFIVPEKIKDLEEILPHYSTTSGLISFSGSLPKMFAEIAWTASPILPSYAEMENSSVTYRKKKEYGQSLGILSTPLSWIVQSHIKNISTVVTNLEIDNLKRDKIENIMDRIYLILDICDNYIIQNLLEEAVPLIHIPAYKAFVTPTNVFTNLKEEIVPYMYMFPLRYGKYLPLFKEKFSVKQKPSCENYARVLSMIYNITQNKKLSPEEQRSVVLALKGLVQDEEILEAISVTELYLPSRDGIMVNSSWLYVADNQDLEKCILKQNSVNLPIFHGFAKMGIQKDDARFVRLLPKCLKPKFLTDVLVEELDNENLIEVSGPLLENIKKFLCTPEFIQSVLRIVNHEKGKGLSKQDTEVIIKGHEAVEVKQVKSLVTNLFFNEEKMGPRPRYFFIQTRNTNEVLKKTLYIANNCTKTIAKDGLTEAYKSLLNISDSDLVLILKSVFDHMRKPSDLEMYLNSRDLKAFGEENLNFFIPEIGSYLDPEMVDLLDNGFYSFHENEIVAMEKYLQDEYDETKEDDIFIIVQVKQLVKENNEIMQSEYEVDIGEGNNIVAKASQLFKFVRNKGNFSDSFDISESNLETENNYLQSEASNEIGFNVGDKSNNSYFQPDFKENLSVQEIMKRIRKQLIEIWEITDLSQRRQLVRRLQLKWHPDKNSTNKAELCTQCFQYIQSLIARLERGETIPEEEDYNTAPKEYPSDQWSNIFRRSHYESSNDGNYRHDYNRSGRQSKRKDADRLEAQLWMKQAEHDFQAAQEEFSQSGSPCWISYKCYEVS